MGALTQEELVRWLIEDSAPGPLLVMAAHPDDETIALGGHPHLLQHSLIVHVTDGAVRGRGDREAYALARREELHRALSLAGVAPEKMWALGAPDQESMYHLPALSRMVESLIAKFEPRAIFTHPYEGGHPDHDSTAFLVHTAARAREIPIIEFTSYYHASLGHGPAEMCVGEFLPRDERPVVEVELNEKNCELKRRMMSCFASQEEMLRLFPIGVEKFRLAPEYDFRRPPHPGVLLYEDRGWGKGAEWRRCAEAALSD